MQFRLSELSATRAVGYWVLLGVFMLGVQIILGGITRLTGSGLSITEWSIVTGTLPPLDAAGWGAAFAKYRQTPQFHLLHADFQLADFKFIYFWEWFHRLWARAIAAVFILGFAWLVWKGKMKRRMVMPLVILFLLGAAQGTVGWIMVLSGLSGDAIYVQPTKLALHFCFALALVCGAFWFALRLLVGPVSKESALGLPGLNLLILTMLFIQLGFGALMAGNKAATAAPTWPSMNGDWVPASLSRESPFWINFMDNPLMIQFVHRGLAYLIFLLIAVWSVGIRRSGIRPSVRADFRLLPLFLCSLQILLGICTLVSSTHILPNRWVGFDWLAELHQVNGILLLLTMVYMFYLVRPGRPAL
jgi:cytochrome c oxidase assembly protein subunit 15